MDLIFETQRGSSFSIEVGYFDTVLEIKGKIEKKPPQRLRVMVLPHSPDNEPVSKVPVSVMANENVEELRKELEKLRERNELRLPQGGYFFIHKQNVLDDDQTFLWNGVAHGDTIEVFPGYVTKDGRVNQRYRR
ncbi:hypothetical protein DY000_02010915 [Brassica cretica]|uniref:Ubiquitin-like domain-containing protein n=1 Tax=Brassica cretica TaxID=69181 RepID=A0ABQ7D936_BRACR|nr:hypothetical protein DY000_02010915 [Brassica cretica]